MLPLLASGNLGTMTMNEVLRIPQRPNITGASPLYCLVSYPGHALGGVIPLQRCSQCILQPQPTGPDVFSGVYPNTISSKNSAYILAHTSDNGDPIASPSCRYMSVPIPKYEFTNPSARAGYDTKSILKQSLIQSFPSLRLIAYQRLKNTVYPTIYP